MLTLDRYHAIEIQNSGHLTGKITYPGYRSEYRFSAHFDLLVVRMCWESGMDLEDLADGFGGGMGTRGDWSAIRDSSPEAMARMTERALNWIAASLETAPGGRRR